MELEQFVREETPDFLDVEIEAYTEELEDGQEQEIVHVYARHNSDKYGFEMAQRDDELLEEIKISELNRSYERLIEAAIDGKD